MMNLCMVLLAAVLGTAVHGQSPTWTYYNSASSSASGGGNSGGSWRPMPPDTPPAFQPYRTIDPAAYQNPPQQQGGQQYLPPAASEPALSPAPAGPSQPQQYQLPNAVSGPDPNLGFRVESARGVLQPSSAVPLPFGGMQSFYFSPKEHALYQVMKIMLSPTQFNMIQAAMEKYPHGGLSEQGGQQGYSDPAPQYGPPTSTTEAPQEEISGSAQTAAPPRSRPSLPGRLVYRNRPKYNFTFSLRTWDGEECEFESEPEPNEGQNPRLRPLPVRSKRGIMRCHPIEKGHGSSKGSSRPGAKERTVSDNDKNPLAPFTPPSGEMRGEMAPITIQRFQETNEGLEAAFSVANTNQQPPNVQGQRGARNSPASGTRVSGNTLPGAGQALPDSYLPQRAAAPAGHYGPPKTGYGPPKQEYGPPPEKIEFDEAGTQSANSERGTAGGGYALMGGAAGEV